MKAHLMYRDRDFDLQEKLPPNHQALIQDLDLTTLLGAMARGDKFLLQVATQAVLFGVQGDLDTIHYRQEILKDTLQNEAVVQAIYDMAVEAIEGKRKQWFFSLGRYPGGTLYGGVELLQMFVGILGRLRLLADEHFQKFESEGFRIFFAMLKAELADDYLAQVQDHLKALTFRRGVLQSVRLGTYAEGTDYVLRKPKGKEPGWFERLFTRTPPGYTFRLHERDEAGARALSELRDRGINLVANAAAQSSDHILDFFGMLRTELAFYLGCVNLHRQLGRKGVPVCFPVPEQVGLLRHSCAGLRDLSLALRMNRDVVDNELAADGKNLCIITGANQGGKSTFLRSVGTAQLMMQSGMFVAAESFTANICQGVLTHFKREEDVRMESGKFDEELSRMNELVGMINPDSMILFNESFAATNEREGSEIARQIVRALLEARVKIFFVTHLYEFARELWEKKMDSAIFLRAERQTDGRRTFKVRPGEPLQTSFGADLYQAIFNSVAKSTVTT